MHPAEKLAPDPYALAAFLGLNEAEASKAGAGALTQAREMRMEQWQIDHLQWNITEHLLWTAAQREKWQRWEESRQGIRAIETSTGIGWEQAKPIQKSWSISWRNALFDLFEQPAVRNAMDADLYSIIYDILRAQHDYRQELEALRTNPDPGKLKAIRQAAETGKPSAAIADAVDRLRIFVQGVERKTRSLVGSNAGRGNGKRFVNQSNAEQVGVDEYKGWITAARDGGKEKRSDAMTRIIASSGRSKSTIANVFSELWPAKAGKQNTG